MCVACAGACVLHTSWGKAVRREAGLPVFSSECEFVDVPTVYPNQKVFFCFVFISGSVQPAASSTRWMRPAVPKLPELLSPRTPRQLQPLNLTEGACGNNSIMQVGIIGVYSPRSQDPLTLLIFWWTKYIQSNSISVYSERATKTSRRRWAGRYHWDWKKSHSIDNCRYS